MVERETLSVGALLVKKGGTEGEPIHLVPGQTLRVGRVASNDLVLDDGLVSRFHAVFNASDAGLVLSDLSSLNGTFVNGRRVTTPVNLRAGDVVSIGGAEIAVRPGTRDSVFDDAESPGTIVADLRRVVITVLVADVCGYTRFSEQFPANDVAATLQLWFRRVSETVEEFGGSVDKYIGDCVMAIWCGQKGDAHVFATQAARAALAIRERTDALSVRHWPHHDTQPWRCHLSLNSGEALMGTLGGAIARDYTVLGDCVNVAFRLNDLNEKVGRDIVLSAETAKLITGRCPVEPLGTTPIEGRAGTVELFSLSSS